MTKHGKKNRKWRARRPAVIGRSIRLTAHGWQRQHKPATDAPPDNGAYQPPPLPSGMAELSEHGQSRLPHPLFFFILAAAAVFIVTIARLVSTMPDK